MSSENFFYNAFIYLAAAVISVPIAKRLGLGSVLGHLLAGIIIGHDAFSDRSGITTTASLAAACTDSGYRRSSGCSDQRCGNGSEYRYELDGHSEERDAG